ncbi:ATP-dependent DNA ligase [Streptomyces acidiscabies]|uniref:ATP-dependent DNA ligase n=1 Tax=Streptomyces acidiscabies TaxID=42234 RepID=UPI00095ADBAD|nr:ATP-dependent DNA ligase [Streptomyces acidiscabies]GAV40619.1 putative DNA ligase-like protein/MT0965 [Streptomyces acidiscabies]
MLLARLAEVSREVAETSARSRKTALLADLFHETAPADVPVVIPYLAGRLPQGRLGIGWKLLSRTTPPAPAPTLTVAETDARLTALGKVAGTGSQAERTRRLAELMEKATDDEQRFLRGLLSGEVRQGALDALAVEALAQATRANPADVRRAVMLAGSLQPVAQALLAQGPPALAEFQLTVGRPVFPMLAHTATSPEEALTKLGPCAIEEKLDGIRIQLHRDAYEIHVYTRTLDDITDRVPELTDIARQLKSTAFILDGEILALDPQTNRPLPFQETAGRVGSRVDVTKAAATTPLSPVFFDALAVDGRDLLDLPYTDRHAELARLVPEPMRVRRALVSDPAPAETFLAETLARGHEGVVLKALDSPYSAGRRGTSWLKVKPVHTLDLVVLAVERGHGRRTGKLSNLHLGARTADGGFAMLGKTFKGMTDAMLTWQTEHLGALAVADDGWTVTVRPELVVEIAYDGLQRSSRYPAGVTLRFARVVRYREDKRPEDADTVETVLAAHPEVQP